MDWSEFIMGAVQGAIIGGCVTILAALVAVAGSIYLNWMGNRKGYKDIDAKFGNLDNKTLVGLIDGKLGKLDNTTLSGQHEQIKDFINQKVGNLLDTTLSGQNRTIIQEVKSIKEEMSEAKNQENLKRQQLTGNQAQIDQSIATLSAFSKLMIELQSENTELRQEIKELKLQNQQLKQQLDLSEQENKEDLSDDPEMKLI